MSWPLVDLSKVCDINIGKTPARADSKYWGNGYPWLSISDMNQGKFLSETKEQITKIAVDETKIKLVPAGTVLFSFKLSIGKIGITEQPMFTNEAIAALPIIDEKKLCKEYLVYALTRMDASKTTDRAVMGATLNKKKLAELKIPLPPLPEQKRIAAILDKADAIRRKRQQAIQLADQFLRAVFLDMFGDPVTNPKGFPTGTIRDLVDSANYGTSEKASESDGEYPILRMGNITYGGGWDLRDLKYIDISDIDKSKYLAQKGDLIFNRTNSRELVGKTAVYEGNEPMAIAGYLIRVRPNEKANTYYLSGYLNSKHGKATLQNTCKSIVGMANINAQELQDIQILIPSRALQDSYANIVLSTNAKLKNFGDSLDQINNLFSSISHKAFSGQL